MILSTPLCEDTDKRR